MMLASSSLQDTRARIWFGKSQNEKLHAQLMHLDKGGNGRLELGLQQSTESFDAEIHLC
jgi:hypothetical protein